MKPVVSPLTSKFRSVVAAVAVLACFTTSAATTLIPAGAPWRYYDEAAAPLSDWHQPSFDDGSWKIGNAQLGYGDGDEATPIASGISRPVTTYFRHTFTVTQTTFFDTATLRLLRDDGAIVYLNGVEICRANMPEGAVHAATPASTMTADADEARFFQFGVWPYAIEFGQNTIAVEVHQAIDGLDDCSFDLELVANLPSSIPSVQLVAPLRGAIFDKQDVPIAAEASDLDGHIRQIDFYAGTNLIGSDVTEPFAITWHNAPLGKHSLTAIAIDNNYHRGISSPINIQVGTNSPTRLVRGPYLQSASTNAITICYRTDWYVPSRIAYGRNESTLDILALDPEETTEHAIRLTGLQPDATYYYAIYADSEMVLGSGANLYFRTAPATNRAVRIWVIGDSGTANTNAANVRDAYLAYSTNRHTDLWLMLGDNAYESGTDAEYQRAVFRMYTNQLPNLVLWPTLGNHDAASSGANGEFPYLDIFALPTSGECGGVASGTERYYSFDFADIHFVCLDSQSSSRLPGSPMLQWLEHDLAATSKHWVIAFWHHPPYSWGTHNSDTEFQLVEMRRYVVPVLEDYGVDLTLCGHSHNYERSFFIHGHHETSGNLESDMILDGGSGDDAIDRAYEKPAGGLGANQGSVFAVCGCSGEGGVFQITRHPAMRVALTGFGSMVIDVDGDTLTARFIRDTGQVDDRFAIVKSANPKGAQPPLAIQRDAHKARLRWPTSRLSLNLEEATTPVGPWSKVTDEPTTLGRWHYLLRNPGEGNRLFRLRED